MPAAGRGPFPVPDAIMHTLHDTRLRRWGVSVQRKNVNCADLCAAALAKLSQKGYNNKMKEIQPVLNLAQ